ncbi:serine aminopeptidase S33 family [Tumebacillus sp. BK434]|uniref:alpha/beta hydrolase n=1 Tax=Tumebacillus sp. BK434 TaxID=2512169 RepID=UPI001049C34D|nr:alpha/beta fold hydrolase [Tumebacillus sp. BK434]TCP54472.1 serine aminopeptidase S33 family [Tumebacillus sp. BK434]
MRRKRKNRIWLWLSFWCLLLVFLAPSVSIAYLGWQYLHPPKKPILETPGAFRLDYQDIAFPSEQENVTLKGWLVPAREATSRIVIFAHGYSENRASANVALHMAKALHNRNIASLLFDFRGAGESDGTMTSLGYYEKQDLLGAIDYAKGLGYHQIGLVGFSMGASTALNVAPEVPEVQAVIADSAFTNLSQYLETNLSNLHPLAEVEFMPKLALWEASVLTGIEPEAVQPILSIQNLRDRGVFLIHAAGDEIIPASESRKLAAASDSMNTVLWVSHANKHVGTYSKETSEYLVRTTAFLSYYLDKGQGGMQTAAKSVEDEVPTQATFTERIARTDKEL